MYQDGPASGMERGGYKTLPDRLSRSRLGSKKTRSSQQGIRNREKAIGELKAWWHVSGEPVDSSVKHIAPIGRVGKTMALVRVDNQLRRNAEITKGVPEFEGLWRRTFPVAVADESEGGSICLSDKCDGGAAGVDLWIVIN